jgi:hypothetical protein
MCCGSKFYTQHSGGKAMLFHTFASQEERRAFGGSDFVEFQMCKLERGASLEKIISIGDEDIHHFKEDSLYLYGDDMNTFYAIYGEIFQGGYYPNGECGPVDYCGINYYTLEQTMCIIEKLKKEKPADSQILLAWLSDAAEYNGLYLLGV